MEIGNILTTERDYFFFYYFKDELEKFYYNGNFG